jgi:hypothetical protein
MGVVADEGVDFEMCLWPCCSSIGDTAALVSGDESRLWKKLVDEDFDASTLSS